MEELFYQMIFKRKSFHIFRGEKGLTEEKLAEIEKVFYSLRPLTEGIEVGIKIVPREETSCKRGEYCVLLFSEQKEGRLQNIGYLGEQLDLWLASQNIGVCWYGMGKTAEADRKLGDLDFVIMLAIEKAGEGDFRKDMFKSKRKPLEEIWEGEPLSDVSAIVRFAPSACNTQPWIVERHGKELKVFRYKKPGKRGMMPIDRVTYYNRIDIGIFLLFLDVCLTHENMKYERTLYRDSGDDCAEKTLAAVYRIE